MRRPTEFPRPVLSLRFSIIISAAAALCSVAHSQTRPGPIPPTNDAPVVLRPSTPTNVETPPVPVEQIIQRFAQNEERLANARPAYTYRKTVKVQEFDEAGKPSGALEFSDEASPGPDGKMYERSVKHSLTTLDSINMVEEDTAPISKLPMFPFTTRQLPKYDFLYAGKQKLDELDTYFFQVHPKQVERQSGLFDGVIWVDTEDFVIVKMTGKWVTELGVVTSPQFPFAVYDTYRENVAGKDWFPSFIRSTGSVPTKNGSAQLRLTVTWEDYKPAAPTAPANVSHPQTD